VTHVQKATSALLQPVENTVDRYTAQEGIFAQKEPQKPENSTTLVKQALTATKHDYSNKHSVLIARPVLFANPVTKTRGWN
jgi:hypothetical protein